jgi:hypothetical protein
MKRNIGVLIALTISIAALIPGEALATANGNTQGRNALSGGLLIAWPIAYMSRRRAIGGWLLYFYIQLYISLVISLIFLPSVISNLNPSMWENSTLYVFFFLSTITVLLAQGFETVAGSLLLYRRDEKTLKLLRKAILAMAVTSGVSVGIDIAYFQETAAIVFDLMTFIFSIIWSLYFSKAQRVHIVFIEKIWDYAARPTRTPLTPQEKSYLWKRVAVAGAIAFVAFFIFMGYEKRGKKPDAEVFYIPIFYALVAGGIARLAPIRKKKREALLKAAI